MVLSPTLPAYSSLLVDSSGNIWLGEFNYEDGGIPRRYAVFDSAGRFISTVLMPQRFTVVAITNDHVWGVAVDTLGVEYLAGYILTGQK